MVALTRIAPSRVATIQLGALVWIGELEWTIDTAVEPFRWPISVAVWTMSLFWLTRSPEIPKLLTSLPFGALVAWASWALVSSNWSNAAETAFLIGAGILLTALASAWYAGVFGWQDFARVIALSSAGFLAAGVIYESLEGSLFSEERFSGIGHNPTDAGRVAMIMAATGLAGFASRRLVQSLFLTGGLAIAYLADARTAVLGLFIGLLLLAFRDGSSRQRIAIILVGTITVIGGISLIAGATAGQDLVARSSDGTEELVTFTGRTQVWSLTLDEISEHPIAGQGVASSLEIFDNFKSDGELAWDPSNAHNMWLGVTMEQGVIGLVLVVISVGGILISVVRTRVGFHEIALVVILVNSATESLIHEPSLALIILAGVAATLPFNRSKDRPMIPQTANYEFAAANGQAVRVE